MNTVKGANNSETKMIKAIQRAIGAVSDGMIGTQTMSDIACRLGADCFPLTLKIYSNPVIIAKDLLPFAGKGRELKNFTNTINGSFYGGGQPCSILIANGQVVQEWSCHAYLYNKPEAVLYKTKDGKVGVKEVVNAKELPGNIDWAIGGFGLIDYYNPTKQGFCRLTANGKTQDFSDVLRKTNHSMIGYKNGYFYLVYCTNMTAMSVNEFAKKLGFELAIMLDGGHIAGINGEESFAKINTSTSQYYIVQGV